MTPFFAAPLTGVGALIPRSIPALGALLAAGALFLTSCSDSSEMEIVDSRELAEDEQEPHLDVSSAQRFRFGSPSSGGGGGDGHEGHDHGEGEPRLMWDVPEGWTEVEASMMRDVSFAIGESKEAECYIARLPGGGGGLAANVNRWRGQMGLEEESEEAIAALPTISLFGQPAKRIELDGSFKGMGAAEAQEGYRLLGAILATPNGAIFIKMTGPKALIEVETERFEEFVASLRIEFGEGE